MSPGIGGLINFALGSLSNKKYIDKPIANPKIIINIIIIIILVLIVNVYIFKFFLFLIIIILDNLILHYRGNKIKINNLKIDFYTFRHLKRRF